MPEVVTLSVRPRQGRGLNTRFGGQDSEELWDSFTEFRNLVIQEGGWVNKYPGQMVPFSFVGMVRSAHYFNRDIGGTLTTSLLAVAGTNLIKSDLAVVEALASPYDIYFSNAKNRVFYGGRNNEPRIWDGTMLATWGVEGPLAVLAYSSLVQDNVVSKVQVQTVSVVNMSPTVTRVSGTNFVTGSAWVGKTIMISGVEYTIQSVASANSLTLAINYTGATASPVPAQVHYGNRSWTVAPKYAYAYYNPTTGHCSNGSPVLTLAEQEMTNVNPEITAIATNATLAGYGFTKIVIFRTAANGSSLLPLKVPAAQGDGFGMFNNSGGPLTFTDDTDDSQLGQVLGFKEMPTENDPCPQHTYQAYHQGRFWVISEAEPWRVYYSADPTLPLGVPEESFPPPNYVDINTDDGYGTGLKVVGGSLIVTTTRFAQVLVGSNPGDFDLRRLSTRGFGVAQRAIDEHPGDSTEESASAIYVSRDRRMWRHFEGGRIEDIGSPIQEFLDATRSLIDVPSPYIVHVFMVDRYWFCALGISSATIPAGQSPQYDFFFYDFDQQAWLDLGYRAVYGNLITAIGSFIQMTGAAGDGKARLALFRGTSTNQAATLFFPEGRSGAAFFKTRPIDHGDWKAKKKLSCIRLYTSDETASWQVAVTIDGAFVGQIQLERANAGLSPRYKGIGVVEFVPKQVIHYHAISVEITWDSNKVETRLNRFDIDLTPETSAGGGSPS